MRVSITSPWCQQRQNIFTFFVLALLVTLPAHALAQVQYSITDLGTLGGLFSTALGINNNGQVVGWSQGPWIESESGSGYYPIKAFLYNGNGPIVDLGTIEDIEGMGLPRSYRAYAINNKGQVVGSVGSVPMTGPLYAPPYGYVWPSPSWYIASFLSTGPGSMQLISEYPPVPAVPYANGAFDINDNGQVVGVARVEVEPDTYATHAFVYNSSNGATQELGTLGGSNSVARGINNSQQIVGWSQNSDGVERAFIVTGGGPMQEIGTLGGIYSNATAINDGGHVVGSAQTSDGERHAFYYSGSGTMQDLGTLGGTQSIATAVNNRGQVVGWSTNSENGTRAFIKSGNGTMQNLNDLIAPNSGWTLGFANAINDKGQIVGFGANPDGQARAFLLTPLNPLSRTYYAPEQVCAPGATDRLARWNGEVWESVSAGEISGNVRVLVHGWMPGARQWVDDNGGANARAWNSPKFDSLTELAKDISAKTGETVLAYSWIDKSATEGALVDYNTYNLYAAESRKNANDQGNILYDQLKAAVGLNDINLQLIGHSHGAKVATIATKKFNASGTIVDHLTLLDSPEECLSASNSLYGDLASIAIGSGTGKTFVDSYISSVGAMYGNNVVNVHLDGPYDPINDHRYPIEWYARSARDPNYDHVGLDWSPLTYNGGQSLASDEWFQIWRNISGPGFNYDLELNLQPASVGTTITNISVGAINGLQTLFQSDNVTGLANNSLLFTKHSPAYWDSTFIKNDGDIAIQFMYEFIQPGEGDQLGVWIDDELKFVVTGLWAGTGQQLGIFDISALTTGSHTMTVALHDYGDAPAQFIVGDFRMIAVPEPSTILLLITGAFALAVMKRRAIGRWAAR